MHFKQITNNLLLVAIAIRALNEFDLFYNEALLKENPIGKVMSSFIRVYLVV